MFFAIKKSQQYVVTSCVSMLCFFIQIPVLCDLRRNVQQNEKYLAISLWTKTFTKDAQGGMVPTEVVDPTAVLNSDNYDKFVQDVLVAHNHYRSLHGVPALELKNEVSNYSLNWAKNMLRRKKMEHSPKPNRINYGENVYYFSGKYMPGNLVVQAWYNESIDHNYQYGTEPKDLRAGHFTQLIWRDAKYLGVGAVACSQGLFVVCNYEPRGNINGQFATNVPPPLGASV